MEIKGKRYFSIRLLGMVILFFSFLIQLILNLIFLDDLFGRILIFIIIFPWFCSYLSIKFEFSYITNSKTVVFIFLFIYTLIIIILILLDVISFLSTSYIIFQSLFMILLLTSWNFSLSIYKKKKIIFFLSGILCIIINLVSIKYYFKSFFFSISFINSILILMGIISIFLMEKLLKRKGLLKYL